MKTTLKKVFCCICVLTIMMSAFPNLLTSNTVKAASYKDDIGNVFSYTISNSKAYIKGYTGNNDVVIPAEINGYPVTNIAKEAFKSKSITSITIPSTIEYIGEDAFLYCSSLENVYISDIGAWCGINFYDWSSQPMYYAKNTFLNGEILTELNVPATVTSIDNDAFTHCSSLISVTLPENITYIGSSAFAYCVNLKSINLPDAVTYLGNCAFWQCEKLEKIEIPINLTEIQTQTFQGCSNLKDVKLPENLNTIGNMAFSGCGFSNIDIPYGVTTINISAFSGCTALKEIVIPSSVTSIGDNAFCGCDSLIDVEIPNSITYIPCYMFYNCANLESAKIPKSVIKLGYRIFMDCPKLTDIYYEGNEEEWNNIELLKYKYYVDGYYDRVNMHYNSFISEENTPDSGVVDKEFLSTASFEKWHAYFLTNTSNAVDLAVGSSSNSMSYSYFETAKNKEFSSRTLYNAYKDETVFNIGTYLYGVIDGKDVALGLSEYYDLILASIIKESYMTDFSMDDTKSSIGNNFSKVVESVLFELGGAVGKDVYTISWDVADTSVVSKAFAEAFPDMTYGEIVEASKLSLKGTESLGEVIERGVVVGQLARHNKATVEVLTDMKNATNDGDLKSALSDVIAAYTDYSDPVNIITSFAAKGVEIGLETVEQAIEIVSDKVISTVLETFGLGVVSATLSIGTAVSDFIFSTGEKCELYFTLKATNKIEDSIKSVMSSYGSADITKISNDQAAKIIEVNRLLHTNALFGLKASKRFVDITYGDSTLAFKIYRSDDTKAMYADYSHMVDTQVTSILTNYDSVINLSKKCFELLKSNNSDGTESVNPVIENVVERITITPPQKLNYIAGESLDTAGMVITAHMTDGTTKNVTSGYLMYGFDTDALGPQEITVEYENATASFTVVVEEDGSTLSHIEVILKREPLTYYQHENFNSADIAVVAHCMDGTSYDVKRCTLINYSSEVVGKRTLTIRYCGKTADFEIEIIEPQLTGLKLLEPNKKVYYINDKIDLTGLGAIAVYNTGTHMLLNRGQYDCSHDVITNSGINTITISYGNVKSDFDVVAYSNKTVLGVLDAPIYSDGNTVTTNTIYNYDKMYTTVYNASNQKTNLYIIAAFYNKNSLVDTSIVKMDFDAESKTFELDIPDNMTNVTEIKLFYWDYNTIAPLTYAIEI